MMVVEAQSISLNDSCLIDLVDVDVGFASLTKIDRIG